MRRIARMYIFLSSLQQPITDSQPPATEGPSALFVAICVVIIILFLAALGVLLKILVRQIGTRCQFCNARLKYWDQLDPADARAILGYFEEVEKRSPDTAGVFTCLKCGAVFDDFSGLRLHRDYDAFGLRAYCKKCNSVMWNRKDLAIWDGESESPYMKCDDCGTVHQFKLYGDTRFKFLMPPAGVETLKKCDDSSGTA
jgi:hypothetical protein